MSTSNKKPAKKPETMEEIRGAGIDTLRSCDALCEATDYERHALWSHYHHNLDWFNDGGFLLQIGKLANEPVAIVFTTVKINHKTVVFWYPSSLVFSHTMAEEFFSKYCKNFIPKNDPTNFGHTLDDLGIKNWDYKTID